MQKLNPMKPNTLYRWAAPLVAAFALLFATPGCSLFKGTTESRLASLATYAELAAYTGAGLDLSSRPANAVHYRVASEALKAALLDPAFSPSTLAATLAKLPVKELRGAKGALLVQPLIVVWQDLSSGALAVDSSTIARTVAAAVVRGFDSALAAYPAAPVSSPPVPARN